MFFKKFLAMFKNSVDIKEQGSKNKYQIRIIFHINKSYYF